MNYVKKTEIINLTNEYFSEIIKHRRYLHAHPELSLNEYNTTEYLFNVLSKLPNIEIERINPTGLIARFNKNAKTAIALRSDIDALPINENTNLPYSSVNKGVMHACGHDAHMSILLGVAYNISRLQSKINHGITLIFQNSEEVEPGGALKMIENGCLENPKVLKIYGLHVDPNVEKGKIMLKEGSFYAGCESFDIVIKGRSAHIARPECGCDAILASSMIIKGIQEIKEKINEKIILGFGKINGGTVRNIIASDVILEGTLRTTSMKTHDDVLKLITELLKDVDKKTSVKSEIILKGGYPVLVNDEKLTNEVIECVSKEIGNSIVEIAPQCLMISEDFSYYGKNTKACFYNLGVGISPYQLHNDKFSVDEDALPLAIIIQTILACRV